MAWVNAQLKKRPSVKPVQDLRQDLRDGVILAYLIEIVGQLALDSDASIDENMTSFSSMLPSEQVVPSLEYMVLELGRQKILAQG